MKHDKSDPLSIINHGLPNRKVVSCWFVTNLGLEQNYGELLQTKIHPNIMGATFKVSNEGLAV